MKAVAVCPDGKEFRALPSGRFIFVMFFIANTVEPMSAYAVPRIIVRSP